MNGPDSQLAGFFRALSDRIARSTHPTWPLPIFEAESFLYCRFLPRLLAAFDGLVYKGYTPRRIADLLLTPTRITELGYLLLGVRYSALRSDERRRLASHLVRILFAARPEDPLCCEGTNRPASATWEVSEWPASLWDPVDRTTTARLSSTMLALAELDHVGVPQYGRELQGPYQIDHGHFVLVKYHSEMGQRIWPFMEGFPDEPIWIIERYEGPETLVALDLTNHLMVSEPLAPRLRGAAVVTRGASSAVTSVDPRHLLSEVKERLQQGIARTSEYKREDWLLKHLQARHTVLTPLESAAGMSVGPSDAEVEYLCTRPQAYRELQPVLSGSAGQIFQHLYADFESRICEASS